LTDRRKTSETEVQRVKLQRAADGKKAMLEYEAEAAAVRAKTAKLRALRLGSEAAAAGAIAATDALVAAQPKAKTAKRKKSSSGTLSDWLKDQAKDGR
jgi:hypothetical protein